MENTVANIFVNAGIPFRQEVYSREWTAITEVLGDDEKRFDFVVETSSKVYLIEVNFYSGGGSKLNEVARSYSDIAPKINSVDGFEFVCSIVVTSNHTSTYVYVATNFCIANVS